MVYRINSEKVTLCPMNKAAEWLIEKRKSKNLSLRQLAEKVGLSHVTISKAEEGDGSFETWTALANYFNESPQVVLSMANMMPKSKLSPLAERAAHLIESLPDEKEKETAVRFLESWSEANNRKVVPAKRQTQ